VGVDNSGGRRVLKSWLVTRLREHGLEEDGPGGAQNTNAGAARGDWEVEIGRVPELLRKT